MTVHEQWLKGMEAYKTELQTKFGIKLELPPPSLKELGTEFLEILPGEKMKAKFPFQKRFTNPVGLYQGGFLAAALDEVFGPLSYLTAQRPCMTLSMNITYLKAFTENTGHCFIEAKVLQKTKNFIFMQAFVTSPKGDLIAHAESHVNIMQDEHLKKVPL